MNENRPEIAWWFAAEPKLPHGDNRPVVVGETHWISGELELCKNALHWSRQPWDALEYATGHLLYQVRPEGRYIEEKDKGGSQGRTYLAMRDVEPMLWAFARSEALRVAHLWDCPAIVRQYLETGDETVRAAAWAASGAALEAVAWVAMEAAVRAAARAAAWAAMEAAVKHAAGAAAAAAAAWTAAGAAAAWTAAWVATRERFAQVIAEGFKS